MAESLRWHGKIGFNAAPKFEVPPVAGAPAAQIRQFGNLSWIQIEAAGHMVAADHHAAAFLVINHLLHQSMPWLANVTRTPGPTEPLSVPPNHSPSHRPSGTARSGRLAAQPMLKAMARPHHRPRLQTCPRTRSPKPKSKPEQDTGDAKLGLIAVVICLG